MLLLSYPFPVTSVVKNPARARTHVASIVQRLSIPTPGPGHRPTAADGLGHYINSRLSGERFRID